MPASLRDKLFQTEAIVLGRLDYGEADRILVVFTPNLGKLDLIVKGARKTQSRLGPGLDLFANVSLELARGRELDVVRSVEPVRRFDLLRTDLDAYGHASYYAELVRAFTQPREEHPEIYELLVRSLILMNEGLDVWMITRHFEMALLAILGYRPELFQCVSCHRPIQAQVNAFSSSMGGLLCEMCRGEDPGAIALSVNAQKYLRILERDGLSVAARVKPSLEEKQEIQHLTASYIRHVAEREFQSLRVINDFQSATLVPERSV
jgi:DNA repair protein RecO (recombination protein O)